MKDTKKATVLYTVQVTANTLTILDSIIESGKNATVLRTIAVNMKDNKKLPKWALHAFSKEHFEHVFSLKAEALRKACKSDSYDLIRTIANIDLKGDVISEAQALKLKELLKIQTFGKNEVLQAILAKFEKSLVIDESQGTDSITDPAVNKKLSENVPETKSSAVFTLAEQIKALNLVDALELQQVLADHIASLAATDKAEKAA